MIWEDTAKQVLVQVCAQVWNEASNETTKWEKLQFSRAYAPRAPGTYRSPMKLRGHSLMLIYFANACYAI